MWILYTRNVDDKVDEKRYVDEGVNAAYDL